MRDLYTLDRMQKYSKKSDTQLELEEQTKKQAEHMETENYHKTKNARINVMKSISTIRDTNDQLRKQSEDVQKIKKAAANTNRNVKKSQDLLYTIERESRLLGFLISFLDPIREWWRESTQENEASQKLYKNNRQDTSRRDPTTNPSATSKEYVKGQKRTDDELTKILAGLREVNFEADIQRSLISEQRKNIQNIDDLNRHTQARTESAEEKIDKML